MPLEHRKSPWRIQYLAAIVALVSMAMTTNRGFADEPSQTTTVKANLNAVVTARQGAQPQQLLANAQQQGFVLPEEVDRNDPNQRMLVLTPDGPLVVELRLKIDGRPFATAREEMVDTILKAGDPSPGQHPGWENVLRLPRLAGGRFIRIRDNPAALKGTISGYDLNGNGLAEAMEVRLFLAQTYSGAAFGIVPTAFPTSIASISLYESLDQDSNRVLSEEELKAIKERLHRRDIDDNEIIEAAEIVPPQNYYTRAQAAGTSGQSIGLLLAIGPGADSEHIRKTLLARYAKDAALAVDQVPLMAALVRCLDFDSNGTVDDAEWKQLDKAPSQIALEVNLGSADDTNPGMTLVNVAEELGPAEKVVTFKGESKLTLALAGCQLELFCSQSVPGVNYQQSAQAMIDRFDQDKNGYLEMTELGQMAQGFAGQFEMWDINQDGKVYLEEIRSAYEESQRPAWDRVLVGGVDLGRAIFEHLDINGDSRISLRESRQAEERLLKLDRNGNGQVESEELPVTLRVGIGRGTAVYQLLYSGAARTAGGFVSIGGARNTNNPAPLAEPRWFTGMDRNVDDDLSPREFLGTPAQFAEFDADGDGLISRDEARALNPGTKDSNPGGGS